MYRIVPLEAFENSEMPVFAADANGLVRYYNRATAELTGCDPGMAIGRPCWRFIHLRDGQGAPFCCRECPVLRGAHAGRSPDLHPVVFRRPAREPLRFLLLSFLVPPEMNGRWAVLHMLEPPREPVSIAEPGRARPALARPGIAAPPGIDPPVIEPHFPAPAKTDRRLGLLTIREKEILNALATGLDVVTIAERFCISDFTVRNHIQHILHKLHLHRQVDAILILLEKHPDARPQE